jgi:hypothetical protein
MITLSYISNRDLSVRIQSIQCCLADKANKIVNDISIGTDCECKLKQLELATILLESIKCYNTNLIDTVGFSGGTRYEYTYSSIYSTEYSEIEILVDGESIVYYFDEENPIKLEVILQNLVLTNPDLYWFYTKNNTDDFTFIIFNPTEQEIIFSLDGSEYTPQVIAVTEPIEPTYYDSQNEANCLTVKQLDNILQYLANYCGSCFLEYEQYDNL